MDRSNHYEAAFEGYLQRQGLCYVAVDERRRPWMGDSPVKSLDFVVFSPAGSRLVVDIKGRRFPTGPAARPRRVWECWSTRDDVEGLGRWADLWGGDFRGLLVFAYHVLPSVELPPETEDVWPFRGRRYLLRAVDVAEYRRHMRPRSPRWQTVTLPRPVFRSVVRPLHHFTGGSPCFARPECLLQP
jgi:hypothetical protein